MTTGPSDVYIRKSHGKGGSLFSLIVDVPVASVMNLKKEDFSYPPSTKAKSALLSAYTMMRRLFRDNASGRAFAGATSCSCIVFFSDVI